MSIDCRPLATVDYRSTAQSQNQLILRSHCDNGTTGLFRQIAGAITGICASAGFQPFDPEIHQVDF